MRFAAFFFVAATLALLSTAAEPAAMQGPAGANDAEEQTLRSAGLNVDEGALLEFFRERTQPKANLGTLLALARQLGDANALTRAKASAKLIACGAWAVPALHHVINELDNPVAIKEARHCLEWIEGKQSTELPIAAAKLLAAQKPAAAVDTLLAYLPLADDQAVVDALKAALVTLVAGPGKTNSAVLAALQDPLPLRRAIAVEVLAASGKAEHLPEVRKLLADAKPQVRLRAALALSQRGDETAIGVLIDLLADLTNDERRLAEQALQNLAGEWAPTPPLQGDDDLSRRIRREAWAGWWRTVDGPALMAAFRLRTLSKQDFANAESLIEQLGAKSFANRERAVADLLAMGPKVVDMLRKATKSTDLERSHRAEICLKQILKTEETEKLPAAAPRLLAVRQPAGAAEALLEYLPFTEDNLMKEEIGRTLKNLAVANGKPDPALLRALQDPVPLRRMAAAEALTGAGGAAHPAVRKLLTDADPEVRLSVAVALVHAQDREAVPALIDLVVELPRGQAWEAEDLLRRIAGAKAPPVPPSNDAAARKKLREDWETWWKDHGAAVNLAELEKAHGFMGLTIVAELGAKGAKGVKAKAGKAAGGGGKGPGGGGGLQVQPAQAVQPVPINPALQTGRLVALDRNTQPQWQIEGLDYPIDFQMVSGDRVLIAEYTTKRVTERDLKGKILWEANGLPGAPINVQRLANGNTFIAAYNSTVAAGCFLVEVDRAGKTVSTINASGGGGGKASYLRGAYKKADGQTVCLMSTGACVRLDATGKEVKIFPMPVLAGVNFFGNIDVTAKGHVITLQRTNNAVTEYDPDGKIVWQANAVGNRATRLINGNTLVASDTAGVFELDNAGKTVWQYQPPPGFQAIRARQVGGPK